MPRNLDRRVEVAFPIDDDDLKEKVIDILNTTLKDNVKARILGADGVYERALKGRAEVLQSQMVF